MPLACIVYRWCAVIGKAFCIKTEGISIGDKHNQYKPTAEDVVWWHL